MRVTLYLQAILLALVGGILLASSGTLTPHFHEGVFWAGLVLVGAAGAILVALAETAKGRHHEE